MLCTTSAGLRRRGTAFARRAVRGGRGASIAAAALLLVGVVACSDADSGRRFANEPAPTRPPPTARATVDPALRPTSGAVWGGAVFDPAAAGPLLDTRGAPKRLYFLAGGDLWTIGADGGDARRIYAPNSGEAIQAIASSPGVAAAEVALLLAVVAAPDATPAASPAADGRGTNATPAESSATSLLVLTADGVEVRRLDRLESALGSADLAALPVATGLAWSPQGGKVLATFAPGGIVVIPRGEAPTSLPLAGVGAVMSATWSPAGDAIAVVVVDDATGRRRLLLAPVAVDAAAGTPAPIAPAPDETGDVSFAAWLPDGSGVIYAVGTTDSFGSGDLYRVARDGGGRALVASAGRAAPVAQIAGLAVAPDGSAVAYTVAIPDPGGGLLFHSLWVQSLKGGDSFQAPIAPGLAVAQLWWSDGGLVWRAVAGDFTIPPTAAAFALQQMNGAGEIAELFAYAPAVGTPEASPVADAPASPDASAGPVVDPVASPAATPNSPPPATPAPQASPPASPVVGPIRSPFSRRP